MNQEILKKAREAKSPEELLKLANDIGAEGFSEERAEELFNALHRSGELSDEELDVSAGGCSGSGGVLLVTRGNLCSARHTSRPQWICKNCKQPASLCRCLPDPSGFEDDFGFAFKKNVKNACETCQYMQPYKSGGNYSCGNPAMNK